MKRFLLLLFAFIAGCDVETSAPITTLPVQGAAIDGSEDPAEPIAEAPAAPESAPMETSVEASAEATPADGSPMSAATEVAVTETPVEPEPGPEPEPEQDGPVEVGFRDLSLIDYDVDAMLDLMLFPDEYEGEDVADLEFPEEITRLEGKEISLVGYMIPGRIEKGGNVRDFMLVRDLLGCCFGGAPMPDEWVDVVVEEGTEAEYRAYMPMRVTGKLTLGGDQDEAGFALGVYRISATAVTAED